MVEGPIPSPTTPTTYITDVVVRPSYRPHFARSPREERHVDGTSSVVVFVYLTNKGTKFHQALVDVVEGTDELIRF